MKKAFIISFSIFSCIILVMSVVMFSARSSLTTTTASLEGIYQRSFYDLVDNVNNVETDISKLMVTNDSVSQQKLLSNIKQKSSDAQEDLSLLPINSNLLNNTTKFMNQLNGYCTSLISYKDGKIEDSDFESMSTIYSSISKIKQELNTVMEKIMGGYRISDNIGNENIIGDFSNSFLNLTNDSVEYPSLIYDGPFSDSIYNRKIKGLPQEEITKERAEEIVLNIFGKDLTNVNFLQETKGAFETFDFGASTAEKNYFIQITKRGGFLLNMNSNVVSDEVVKEDNTDELKLENNPQQKVEDICIGFAEKLGIENMQCVWSASSNNISYVNLAPVVDDIIMYPDLIKAKVDLTNNSILGWEATAYAYNHVEREDLIPQITEKEARDLVSKNLSVETQKLCVIPLDFIGETLAYEFAGKYNDFNYYLYIDAYTGNQVRVLRIIQTDEGNLVV